MLNYSEYVYAVYRFHSFSKAAQELHVSQPWLSTAIKKVEQELKLPLFDRSVTPISLTEAGEYYIEQIEKIKLIEHDMQLHFEHLRSNFSSTLRIGGSMFFSTYVFPSLLRDFQEQNPQITLNFVEGSSADLKEKLKRGEIDLMLEAESYSSKSIQSIPWITEEIILAVPAEYQIAKTLSDYCYTFNNFVNRNLPGKRKPPVPLSEFKNEPFLLQNQVNDIYTRSLHICRNAGFEPRIKLMLSQMMTTYYLACEGQGIAFLRSTIPDYVSHNDKVVFFELADPLATRNIYLSHRAGEMTVIQRELFSYMISKSHLPQT